MSAKTSKNTTILEALAGTKRCSSCGWAVLPEGFNLHSSTCKVCERSRFRTDAYRETNAKSKEKHAHKQTARDTANNAIKAGRLKREACQTCGDPKSQAHHSDYSRPLDVVFLCQKHHSMADRYERSNSVEVTFAGGAF